MRGLWRRLFGGGETAEAAQRATPPEAEAGAGSDGGTGLILLYHRVASPLRDPQALSVSAEHFAAHLKVLKEIATPIDLAEMAGMILAGSPLPRRAVAISFDDGYADNIAAAEPLLADAGLTATVFVSTGHVSADAPFWWDRVEEAVLGALPAGRHELTVGSETIELAFNEPPFAADEWTALKGEPPTGRHRAYADLMARLKPLPLAEMTRFLAELSALAGLPGTASPEARPATPGEIAASAARGTLRFEAHTRDHPQLALLPREEQARQIVQSAEDLQAWTGRRPTLFAYPYGSTADFDAATERAVAEAGFEAAFANVAGLAGAASPRWAIPRLLVRDVDAATFRYQIDWHFAHLKAA